MYRVRYEKEFHKNLKSLDPSQARLILAWIKKNLDQSNNPREKGKRLKGKLNEYWRYRIGDYRLLCEIKDDQLILICIAVGHRKNIYDL